MLSRITSASMIFFELTLIMFFKSPAFFVLRSSMNARGEQNNFLVYGQILGLVLGG